MSGKIFGMGLSEEAIKAIIAAYPNGGRFRTPPAESKHNPIHRKRRDKNICERYLSGKTYKEVGEEYHLSWRRIKEILEMNGIRKREETRKSRIDIIREMTARKERRETIAKTLGISRQRLHQIMKEERL